MGCLEERSVAKILVADDNSNIQKMVGLALKDQGIDVVAVGNGEAAVRKISDLKPDLVLADVFMPVRNGYEVCSYVKQDPALSHIPVILLVGAFDPLDEQEAQRVGADGVLKKPFVPPDPLISMVKSALARAGVALGNAQAAEKAAETQKRNAAELLSPAVSKLAALSAAPIREPEPIPEEFPAMPNHIKIAAGEQPVAFGSLLETPEAEDDSAFIPAKPPTEIGASQNWEADEVAEEEEIEEEEGSGNGWRPGGDLTALDPTEAEIENKVKDWREAAFHGSSPARTQRSNRWAPSAAAPEFAETADARTVAVTTLEAKPAETPAFSGDAWAAALAAGVEEKLAETQEALKTTSLPGHLPEVAPELQATENVAEAAQPHLPQTESRPGSSWYSVSASPWEVEAKKATQLASTWDNAVAEEPAVVTEQPAPEVASPYVEESHVQNSEPVQEYVHGEQPRQTPALLHEVTFESAHEATIPSAYVAESTVNDTQEIESFQPAETKSSENTWVAAPPEVISQFVDAPSQDFVTEQAGPVAEHTPEPLVAEEAPAVSAAAEVQTPNMDDLVARVLSRMSPDVLQKVTHDILKPVIEALIQDELSSRKQ
jgi:CheY-like chemotaxis protein